MPHSLSLAVVYICYLSPLSLGFTFIFFFNDTATTEIYTLSLHDALPISDDSRPDRQWQRGSIFEHAEPCEYRCSRFRRSEEHTSELQSQSNLVCRLLLEKKKKIVDLSICPKIT